MTQLLSLQRANRAAIALLLVAALLLLAQTLASVVAGLVALVLIPVAYLADGAAQRSAQQTGRRRAQSFRPAQPRLTVEVYSVDGTSQAAQIVPVEQTAGYRTVLTTGGYAVVADDGRIVYRLRG